MAKKRSKGRIAESTTTYKLRRRVKEEQRKQRVEQVRIAKLSSPILSHRRLTSKANFKSRIPTCEEAGTALIEMYAFLKAKNRGQRVRSSTVMKNIGRFREITATQLVRIYMAETIADFLKLNPAERKELIEISTDVDKKAELLKDKLEILHQATGSFTGLALSFHGKEYSDLLCNAVGVPHGNIAYLMKNK